MQILFYEDPRDRCDAKTLDRADAHGLNRIGVEYPGGGEHGSVCKQDGPRAVGIEVADMCRAAQFRWRTGMALPGEVGWGGGERDGKISGEAGGGRKSGGWGKGGGVGVKIGGGRVIDK